MDHAGNAGLGLLDISSVNGEHGGCGGLAGFAGGRGPGGGCWFGGGSGVGAIGANGHGEDSSPDAGGNRTRVREAERNITAVNIYEINANKGAEMHVDVHLTCVLLPQNR